MPVKCVYILCLALSQKCWSNLHNASQVLKIDSCHTIYFVIHFQRTFCCFTKKNIRKAGQYVLSLPNILPPQVALLCPAHWIKCGDFVESPGDVNSCQGKELNQHHLHGWHQQPVRLCWHTHTHTHMHTQYNTASTQHHMPSPFQNTWIQGYWPPTDIKMCTGICLGDFPLIQCINKQHTMIQAIYNVLQIIRQPINRATCP